MGLLIAKDGTSQGAQYLLHAGAVTGVVQQFRHLHQLHAGELVHGEGVEVVPPLLAVTDDVNAGVLLGADAGQDLIVGQRTEFVIGDLARFLAAQGADQIGGPGPASDHGNGKQGCVRHGCPSRTAIIRFACRHLGREHEASPTNNLHQKRRNGQIKLNDGLGAQAVMCEIELRSLMHAQFAAGKRQNQDFKIQGFSGSEPFCNGYLPILPNREIPRIPDADDVR